MLTLRFHGHAGPFYLLATFSPIPQKKGFGRVTTGNGVDRPFTLHFFNGIQIFLATLESKFYTSTSNHFIQFSIRDWFEKILFNCSTFLKNNCIVRAEAAFVRSFSTSQRKSAGRIAWNSCGHFRNYATIAFLVVTKFFRVSYLCFEGVKINLVDATKYLMQFLFSGWSVGENSSWSLLQRCSVHSPLCRTYV